MTGANGPVRADDRARIVDVLSRYATAVDDRDVDAIASCFTADAQASYWPGHELCGAEAIAGFIGAAITAFKATQHLNGTHTFAFDDDTAATSTYVQAAHVIAGISGDRIVTVGGRYRDRFVVDDGEWRIAERRFAAIWTTAEPAGSMLPT